MNKFYSFLFIFCITGVMSKFLDINDEVRYKIGRRFVDIKEIPSLLSLLACGVHNCGATIISKYWALTAGHCVHGYLISEIHFRAGSTSRSSGGTIHPTLIIIVHPEYHDFTVNFDFAVVRVSRPFPLNRIEVSAAILTNIEPKSGIFTFYGWGSSEFRGNKSTLITATDVNLISRSECNSKYKTAFTKSMICAGGNGKDSCQGDSGGPLIHKGTGVQVGIVSWGRICADPREPGVYANIADQRLWIKIATGV